MVVSFGPYEVDLRLLLNLWNVIVIMSSSHIPNAVIGGFLVSLSSTLFYLIHSHHLNLAHLFWTVTVLKKKWLFEYLPVVSGIFITSGVLFNWMNYEGVGKVNPYGPKDSILLRTSMYGFAIGGFMIGMGSQLARGDEIFVTFVEIAHGNWFYVVILALMVGSALFWSWLAEAGHLRILTNQTINPQMEFLHLQSANITIALAVIILVLTCYMLCTTINDKKLAARKIIGSFFSGVLLASGFGIAGLPTRTTFMAGITPTSIWDPIVVVFLATGVVVSAVVFHLLKSNSKVKNIAVRQDSTLDNHSPKEQVAQFKTKHCIGALIFGMGWAISGLDVATFLIHGSIFSTPVVIIFGGFLILGSLIGDTI